MTSRDFLHFFYQKTQSELDYLALLNKKKKKAKMAQLGMSATPLGNPPSLLATDKQTHHQRVL